MENSNSKVIKALNDLAETARDGQKGYETAAGVVENPNIKSEFLRLAQQRTSFISELETTAQNLGGSISQTNTVEGTALQAAGAVHRGWINLKSAIGANDSKAILSECENGDEAALKAYDNALHTEGIPVEVLTIIQRQRQDIQAARQMITSLKESL